MQGYVDSKSSSPKQIAKAPRISARGQGYYVDYDLGWAVIAVFTALNSQEWWYSRAG